MREKTRYCASLRQTRREAGAPPTVPRSARISVITFAAVLLLNLATPTRGQVSPSVEYQVKAAFLLNFAKFIDWPANAFPDEKTPFKVCIFGYDPFGSALDEIIRGKNINNRELLAQRIAAPPELKTCQIVFVSERGEKRLPEILNNLKDSSALVVGENENFAERGGSVQLFLENNRMRFAVNVDAVQRARLAVSSKLLALARIVHEQALPKGV